MDCAHCDQPATHIATAVADRCTLDVELPGCAVHLASVIDRALKECPPPKAGYAVVTPVTNPQATVTPENVDTPT